MKVENAKIEGLGEMNHGTAMDGASKQVSETTYVEAISICNRFSDAYFGFK